MKTVLNKGKGHLIRAAEITCSVCWSLFRANPKDGNYIPHSRMDGGIVVLTCPVCQATSHTDIDDFRENVL